VGTHWRRTSVVVCPHETLARPEWVGAQERWEPEKLILVVINAFKKNVNFMPSD